MWQQVKTLRKDTGNEWATDRRAQPSDEPHNQRQVETASPRCWGHRVGLGRLALEEGHLLSLLPSLTQHSPW